MVWHLIELKYSKTVLYISLRSGSVLWQGYSTNRKSIKLAMDEIKHAQASWASPCVFVPKKDGILHFSVDYRKLNAAVIQDSYQILGKVNMNPIDPRREVILHVARK